MSVLLYDADDLIESTRNRAMSPDAESVGSDDTAILRYLNEQLQTKLVPAIYGVREDFGVFQERLTLTASQSRYSISRRSAFNRLRKLFYLPSSGSRRSLPRTQRELLGRFSTSGVTVPQAFYMDNDRIVLVPDLSATPEGTLEVHFYMRPSQVVPVAEVATIDSIPGGGVFHLANTPTAFATAVKYDIHSPESGAALRAWDITATAYSSVAQTLTWATADIDGSTYGRYAPQIGDYVCLAKESGLPFLPVELHPVLCQAAAVELLRAAGDLEGAEKGGMELNAMLTDALRMLDDRTEGDPEAIVNQHSFLQSRGPWYSGRANQF